MRHILHIVFAATVMLTATQSMASDTDTTQKQQQEKFRIACLNEAEKANGRLSMWQSLRHGTRAIHDQQVEEMKETCRAMTEAYLADDNAKHAILAQQCQSEIEDRLKKSQKHVEYLKKFQSICETMTGQKLTVNYDAIPPTKGMSDNAFLFPALQNKLPVTQK